MALTLHQASAPVFVQSLTGVLNVVDKLAAQAANEKIDPALFLAERLYPNMFSYGRQLQAMCDWANNACAWLAGQTPPKFANDERTLEDWKATTGLPWFGFWARELLRWGTLDPFVAFAQAQGRARTREEAEGLREAFETWLNDEVDEPTSEDRIDPQRFLAWERTLPARVREQAEAVPDEARLTGTDGARQHYGVLPIPGDEEVIWVDAAGYELARSDDELGYYDLDDVVHDYLLSAAAQPSVRRTFRRQARV